MPTSHYIVLGIYWAVGMLVGLITLLALKHCKGYFNRRRARKKQQADIDQMFVELEAVRRLIEWDYCNPYKWQDTEMYCPEHDGPKLTEKRRSEIEAQKREYLRTGDTNLLIDKHRALDLGLACLVPKPRRKA